MPIIRCPCLRRLFNLSITRDELCQVYTFRRVVNRPSEVIATLNPCSSQTNTREYRGSRGDRPTRNREKRAMLNAIARYKETKKVDCVLKQPDLNFVLNQLRPHLEQRASLGQIGSIPPSQGYLAALDAQNERRMEQTEETSLPIRHSAGFVFLMRQEGQVAHSSQVYIQPLQRPRFESSSSLDPDSATSQNSINSAISEYSKSPEESQYSISPAVSGYSKTAGEDQYSINSAISEDLFDGVSKQTVAARISFKSDHDRDVFFVTKTHYKAKAESESESESESEAESEVQELNSRFKAMSVNERRLVFERRLGSEESSVRVANLALLTEVANRLTHFRDETQNEQRRYFDHGHHGHIEPEDLMKKIRDKKGQYSSSNSSLNSIIKFK